jgi:polar amino acid transport system substrate-binding protein
MRSNGSFGKLARLILGLSVLAPATAATNLAALAQTAAPLLTPAPGFWDPKRRLEKPDLPANTVIRFLTEVDYPPFNYAGPDGNPIGFNVDLARLLCEELKVACTIQMRRFDTLADAIAENRGDAGIASMAPTPDRRRKLDFTEPYYRSPARFVSLRDAPITAVTPEALRGKRIAVIGGTAHEAYVRTFFAESVIQPVASSEEGRRALRANEADLIFADAIQLAFWLNGEDSAACCVFRGGPFTESRYFGEGIGIAVRRGNDALRGALNWGLFRLWETGRYAELWMRYFPISPY